MKFLGWTGAPGVGVSGSVDETSARARRRRLVRRAIAAVCALAFPVLAATNAMAATTVVTKNAGKLAAVGPVNTVNGFPAWYQDSTGRRVEPCLDRDNPLCGFLAGDVPAAGPIAFPSNFPGEFFYQLVAANLTFPTGGSAALTLGLEGAFANGGAVPGDQQVFARTRIVVKGGPANSTLTFTYPFGTATVDTDATGAGKLVEDKTPAVGNFTTPLAGNFGPFLVWDTGTVKDSTGEYAGDPAVAHKVAGSPFGTNVFSVGGPITASTDQFTVSGKISTNTGVHADAASITPDGRFVDVFATSTGEQLQVEATGSTPKTPMLHDLKSDRFYARLAVTGTAPTTVTVTNIADTPVSTSGVAVATPTGLTITKAAFDGTANKLTVDATSTTPTDVLTVTGYGDLSNGAATFDSVSPPATVEVKTGTGTTARSAIAPVVIANGVATPAQLPITPTNPPGGGTGTGTAPAAPANLKATPGATSVALAWDPVAAATRYQVTVYSADGATKVISPAQPVSTTSTTQNIVGLAVNTTYQFTVTATTATGTSAESAPKVGAKTTAETVTITSARYKTTDFRVVGTSTATSGGTVSVYGVNPTSAGATPLAGMANVPLTTAAPSATGTAFDARVRAGAPRPASGQVWVRTSNGAVAGPFPVS
jgi:hypothetical protein